MDRGISWSTATLSENIIFIKEIQNKHSPEIMLPGHFVLLIKCTQLINMNRVIIMSPRCIDNMYSDASFLDENKNIWGINGFSPRLSLRIDLVCFIHYSIDVIHI